MSVLSLYLTSSDTIRCAYYWDFYFDIFSAEQYVKHLPTKLEDSFLFFGKFFRVSINLRFDDKLD